MSSQYPAVDLLKLGDTGRTKPWLNNYWPQILGVTFGICTASYLNHQTRRPVFSGIQKYIFLSLGFTAAFHYIYKKREDYFAERDAIMRHYVDLHPDEFKEPERKLIGDILEPWIPVR